MVQTTIPDSLDITMSEEDPTEPGDIKIVRGTLLELDDCDADTQWSVESGGGFLLSPAPRLTSKEGYCLAVARASK
jgi:hypothetical protein